MFGMLNTKEGYEWGRDEVFAKTLGSVLKPDKKKRPNVECKACPLRPKSFKIITVNIRRSGAHENELIRSNH